MNDMSCARFTAESAIERETFKARKKSDERKGSARTLEDGGRVSIRERRE